jgi:hypothetical protein
MKAIEPWSITRLSPNLFRNCLVPYSVVPKRCCSDSICDLTEAGCHMDQDPGRCSRLIERLGMECAKASASRRCPCVGFHWRYLKMAGLLAVQKLAEVRS